MDVLEEKFTLVLKSLVHQSAEDNFFWQYFRRRSKTVPLAGLKQCHPQGTVFR